MELCKILNDFKSKGYSRTYKHSNHKSTVFQGLRNFKAHHEPVRTL